MYTADFYVYATLPIDFASYYETCYIAGRPDFEIKKIITNGLACLKLPLILCFTRIVINIIYSIPIRSIIYYELYTYRWYLYDIMLYCSV